MYVLKNKSLRLEIIWLYYNMLIAEHERQQKIVESITRNYWWPGITKEMKQYIEECDQCQRMKNRAEMPARKLKLNTVPGKPW